MTLASSRVVSAPRGSQMSARSWLTEAPLRMLMSNLDPQVAERPEGAFRELTRGLLPSG